MAIIKTPDQRVRVFISSTILELAEERKVAREAISNLRLTPVFFEAGARPHPPRDLYRAYLHQSQIFIGIYWNSYGWTAPDMEISGLEDEYQLSHNKPRLIYVKQPANERQPKLQELLRTIQEHDTASYQKFSTPEELKELLQNDLSLLLSERFEQEEKATLHSQPTAAILPVVRSSFIGRETELASLSAMIQDPATSLITIWGAGGTGKTRLALQLANQVKDRFIDGVIYIPLAAIQDEKLLPPEMAHVLGLFDTGKQPVADIVKDFLRNKELLLLLDNFEQIIDAAPFVSALLESSPALKIMVTSRTPLKIRGEQLFPLQPLSMPAPQTEEKNESIRDSAAVQLFIQRAKEVNPGLVFNEENLQAIAAICRKLDGLPLAIELAAAKVKFLSPIALAARMERSLEMLSGGPRDLPKRQQTLTATIAWSYDLLEEPARQFFRKLAVFNDTWSLEAAAAILSLPSAADPKVLDLSEELLDFGLIRPVNSELSDPNGDPLFTMMQTVKEYGVNMLETAGELNDVQNAHLQYYCTFLQAIDTKIWNGEMGSLNKKINTEYQNIRSAFHHALDTNNRSDAWQLIGYMHHYWASHGRFSEAFNWFAEAGITTDTTADEKTIPAAIIARAFLSAGMISFLGGRPIDAEKYLTASLSRFTALNDELFLGRAKTFLGLAGISSGRGTASTILQEALQLGKKMNDDYTVIIAADFLGEIYTGQGDYKASEELLTMALQKSREPQNVSHLSNTLLQWANLYTVTDDHQRCIEVADECFRASKQSWYQSVAAWAMVVKGQGLLMLGKVEKAEMSFLMGLGSSMAFDDKTMILYALTGVAATACAKKEYERSARLLGAVENLRNMYQVASWSSVQKLNEWLTKEMHTYCTPAEIKVSKAGGLSWTIKDAIQQAMHAQ